MTNHYRVSLWWDAVPLGDIIVEGELPDRIQVIPNQGHIGRQFQLHESTFLSIQVERGPFSRLDSRSVGG